jgi:HK97 family phage portal protein
VGWFRRREKVEQRSGLENPTNEWLLDALGGTLSMSGERVTEKTALGLGLVFNAVERISEAVGSLPLKVYRVQDDDQRVEARSHRAWRMLHDKPNPVMTAHDFWSTVTALMLLRGNAFALKDYDENDEVESLWLLDPDTITVEFDPSAKQKRYVQYTPQKRVYTPDDIVHFMGFSLDGFVGCSRIEYCKHTFGNALARSRFEGEFYKQGAHFEGVIEYPGALGDTGRTNLANAMAYLHHGPGNRHKTPVLEEGATFKPVTMTLEDMQFVAQAELNRTDIAVLFNLPPAYLGGSTGDSLTYATTESNQIQFAQMAVAPLTDRIAKALSADPQILPWNVMYCEFVLEGLLRADMRTRAEYWGKLKEMGVVDEAYIAARENLPKPPKKEPAPIPQPAPPAALEAPQGAFSLVRGARQNGG